MRNDCYVLKNIIYNCLSEESKFIVDKYFLLFDVSETTIYETKQALPDQPNFGAKF